MLNFGVGLGPVFTVSDVCTAFNTLVGLGDIGTMVTNPGGLYTALSLALREHDTTKDRVPGQHFVSLLGYGALGYVSAGVGRNRGRSADDYVVREHRGRMGAFLKRQYAAPVESLAVVVYTKAAYAADPEVNPDEIAAMDDNVTHVVVAVLATAGPNPPLSPYRFVSNLAGGNNEALTYTADDMRRMAKDIKAYDDEWSVVAD